MRIIERVLSSGRGWTYENKLKKRNNIFLFQVSFMSKLSLKIASSAHATWSFSFTLSYSLFSVMFTFYFQLYGYRLLLLSVCTSRIVTMSCYSNREYVDMVEALEACNRSAKAAAKYYRQRFPNGCASVHIHTYIPT